MHLWDMEQLQQSDIVYYFDYFMFLQPWGVCYLAFFQRWRDIKFKKDTFTIIFAILSIIFAYALGIILNKLIFLLFFNFKKYFKGGFMIWARSVYSGVAIIFFWTFFYFFHFLYQMYVLNNESLPRIWQMVSGILILLVSIVSLIVAAVSRDFNDFIGIFFLCIIYLLKIKKRIFNNLAHNQHYFARLQQQPNDIGL